MILEKIQRVISSVSWRRRTVLLIALNIAFPILYVTAVSSTALGMLAQQHQKKVEKHKTYLKLPLEVSEGKIGDKPIALGEPFDGDVDWLKGLKVKVKNKSEKTISWASILFTFPETRLTGPIMIEFLYIGRRSDMKTPNPPLELKPSEEIELSLESHFDSIKGLIQSRGRLDEVNNVDIEVSEVMFSDGTLYSGDNIWKPNPDSNSPHKWLKIGPYLRRP
jgi:hypothetical protein